MTGKTRLVRSGRTFVPFFVAAAVYAVLAVPLWLVQYGGSIRPLFPGPVGHGHEMVFGFALAVVAGYLLARPSRLELAILFGTWIAGRIVAILGILPIMSAPVALAFPALLFAFAGLPFLRARRWRNAVFTIPLAGFLAADVLYQLGLLGIVADGASRGLVLAVDLLTLLMFTMGGRIIAAATSGALQRRGARLEGLAQPRLEQAGVVVLLAMAVLDVLARASEIAGLLAAAAAALVVLRLVDWRVWRTGLDLEVSALHLGYAWLAIGLGLGAVARLSDALPLSGAQHGITVGALGTLTLVMMVRVTLQRTRREIALPWPCLVAIALISAAAVARLLAALPDWHWPLMVAAAAGWSLAFAILTGFFSQAARAGPRPARA